MPRPKSITDDKLMDIALEVIQNVGPEKFTLQDISKKASLSPSTLVQRFGSKTALLKRVILHSKERLEKHLSSVDALIEGDPKEALMEWLISTALPFRERASFASHLSVLKQDILDDEMRTLSRQHIHLFQENIRMYLVHIDPKMDEQMLQHWTQMIEAQWQGLLWQWALSGEGELESWLRTGMNFLMSLHPSV